MPKKKKVEKFNKGEIIIYQASKNEVGLKVHLEKETVWLDARQMAQIFGVQRPAITKHLKNIFESGELQEDSVSSILEHTTKHGAIKGKTQTQSVKFYNLDAIISVGYRVNSAQATQFRIWATKVLKNYLIQGYAINQSRLLEARNKFNELQTTIAFLQKQANKKQLKGQEKEIINLLADYSKTLSVLEKYDKGNLQKPKGKKVDFALKYKNCFVIIAELKKELMVKKEASELFGAEKQSAFESVVKNLYQTFGKKELYKTIEEKAAHLLYLTIKDHPFTDGNKRISSFLFIYFLDKSNYLYRENGEKKINDNTLIALALLIAESNPKEKDVMIKIIMNLISD